MSRLNAFVVSLALGAALGSPAAGAATDAAASKVPKAPLKAIEQAIEASAGGLLLPADSVGTLVVTACDKCAPVSLLVTSRSRYFLGRTPVQLADLRQAVAGRPGVGIVVFYDANTHELTRLTASVSVSVLSAAPAGSAK